MFFELKRIFITLGVLILVLAGILVLNKFINYLRRENQNTKLEEATITIPEGLTVVQMGDLFAKENIFSKNTFVKSASKYEGYLFPDTYRFYKNATPQGVIDKMRSNFDKKVNSQILNEIEQSQKTLNEIVIMASLLEEEAHDNEDRKIIAGILWKRINLGMLLQVDAALNYVIGKTSAELTANDLAIDSLFNTYKYRGLPPAPISNPGIDTIIAALRPKKTDYLYYLSDKGGKIHYARTFEEHKNNKFKYLR